MLFGSAAAGSAHDESDLDVWYVLRREPLPARERDGRLEVVPITLELMRKAPDWLKPARTGAPALQQELCVAVREQAAERGCADVHDGWDGDIDHLLAFPVRMSAETFLPSSSGSLRRR